MEFVKGLALKRGVNGLKKISTIRIPSGTRIRVGTAGRNAYGHVGLYQIEILDKPERAWIIETKDW